MRLGVVLVHGIGAQRPDWAREIIRTLQARVQAEVARRLRGRPPAAEELAVFTSVHWADVLQERQRILREVLEAGQEPLAVGGPWWRALWSRVAARLKRIEHTFVAEFIGDVIGYLEPGARAAVHATVTATLESLAAQLAPTDGKTPVTFIAHSLGTVIASNYLWDRTKARRAQGQEGFDAALRVDNFFSLGSPLALFSLQYGQPETFTSPITVESVRGRWINIFDRDDPVGMPLKGLNDAYRQAVWKDAQVNSGAYLVSHAGYFKDPQTLTIISAKLTLDWLTLNDRLTPTQQDAYAAHYDQTLGLRDVPVLQGPVAAPLPLDVPVGPRGAVRIP